MNSANKRIRQHLGLEDHVREVPTGSMRPVIFPGNSIRFAESALQPRLGEIWVFDTGTRHVSHRVVFVRPDGSVLTKGDACLRPDGWIPRSKLFGPVTSIQRNGIWRPANRRRDRALGLAISLGMTAYLGTRRCGGLLLRRLGLRRP